MRSPFNTIRFKISILYVALLGLILAGYGFSLYFSLREILYHHLDHELVSKAREVGDLIDSYLKASVDRENFFLVAAKKVIRLESSREEAFRKHGIENQLLSILEKYDLRKDHIALLDTAGKPVMTSWNSLPGFLRNLPANLEVLPPKAKRKKRDGVTYLATPEFRLVWFSRRFVNGQTFIIIATTPTKSISDTLRKTLILILATIPFFLFFASFLGRIFVFRILKPVYAITHTAKKITHEDLSLRVKTEGVEEEIRYLGDAFNDMISRLETSFQHIADFSLHVAHELKPPLAAMRGEAQVALRKPREPAEYQRVMEVVLKETGAMTRVIEDMLLLARLDYESELLNPEKFDLVDFFRDIYERTKLLAEKKKILVGLDVPEEPRFFTGDQRHLRRLFFNLVDNALKFTDPDGEIRITLKQETACYRIAVRDTGIGISEEDRPRIFQKFFHHDRPEHDAPKGTGLGLNIALSIARAHKGRIEVDTTPVKGTVFTVILPVD